MPNEERTFYEHAYPTLPHKALEPARRRPLYERLLDRLPAGARRLLDVGCGSGAFLVCARDRGLEAVGLELAHAAARAARERAGVPVLVGGLEALAPAARFDVVTLWNVLDQVPDPLQLLAECRARLAPNGLLFARVPNGSVHRPLMRLLALRPRIGWLSGLTPLHPWLLRPRDLDRLAAAAGFADDQVEVRVSPPSGGSPAGALGHVLARALDLASLGRLKLAPSIELHARGAALPGAAGAGGADGDLPR